ncbi:hypothetical protein GGR55DRAFT_637513 [Xylaria sp. FL0064]|nr:hypothetical protein GGR55DRAFT_637513 [Xylaria sp. FL0064]
MDVVGKLRGEEKSSRRHSRGKEEPLPCLLEDTLGVETNDLAGDEPELAPELGPEDLSSREKDPGALDKIEASMATECHTLKQASQNEALAESFPLEELGDYPTDEIMREADLASDSGPEARSVLVVHTPSDALALSTANSQSRILDDPQHLYAKEDEAEGLRKGEDLGYLETMEPNVETIPVGTEDQAVDSTSPEVQASLETPPAGLLSTLDGPYLDLQSHKEHNDPRISTPDNPDDTQYGDAPEASVPQSPNTLPSRTTPDESDIAGMESFHEPAEEIVVRKDSFSPPDVAVVDDTTRAPEDPTLTDKLAPKSGAFSGMSPSTIEDFSVKKGVTTYEAVDIELPPSPSLSQTGFDPGPVTTSINVRVNTPSKNLAVGAESFRREAAHGLYYVQDRAGEAVAERISQYSPKTQPFVNNDAEISAWETMDEYETSEQVWETTDDDETMEKSGADFRLTREQHPLSDISEVAQERSESPCNSPRNVGNDDARNFKPHDELSHNLSSPNLVSMEEPNVEAMKAEMLRTALQIGSLDTPHQQVPPCAPVPLETHNAEEVSSIYCLESVQEADPLRPLHDEVIHRRHSPNAADGKEPQDQCTFEDQIDQMAWQESATPSMPEYPEFQPHSLDTITEGSDDEFVVQRLGATSSIDSPNEFHSPTPTRPTASFLNDDPLEPISHETPVEHSSSEAQVGPFTRPSTQIAVLDATHVIAGNEALRWPATLEEDADDSEVETQRLPHVFDYTRFVSELPPTSQSGGTGHRSSDGEYKELVAPFETRGNDISHFSQRFGIIQSGIEANQQISRDGFYWSSTRSSSVDRSNQMGFEPLLDDERLGTIDVTFAPTKDLATSQFHDQALRDAGMPGPEFIPSSSSEAHKIDLASDLDSLRNAEALAHEDDRVRDFRFETLPDGSFVSPGFIGPGVDLLENRTFFQRSSISPGGDILPGRPNLVHSSTQTDEDLPHGPRSPSSYGSDEEPRSPTPAIVLPDLNDPKVKALGRAKSLKKKRRQRFREVEETVATAVVIYATAQKLSPPPSPPRGSGQFNKNITETLGAVQGPVQASSDVVSSESSAEHSVDESDFSPTVADLSTDDERHHRHRSHRSHQHSSRSKDSVGSDEQRHLHRHRHHRSKDDGGQSLKTSSDRSISSQHIKEESRRHDSGHEGAQSSSQRRRRTPEEQAAHDKRKEERRARRELDRERDREQERDYKSKEAETTPPTSERQSPRSSRRSGHSDLRPGPSHSERRVSIKEEPSPVSNKKFFDFRRGESILDASRVSPEAEAESPKRPSTSKSHSRSHRESGDSPRAHRTHRDHREPRESRESREHREPRELKEHREHREHREPRESGEVPRPRSSRHHDEPREESSRRHRERSSRAKVDEDPKFSTRTMPESEGRTSTRSRADSAARMSTRSRGDSDGRPSSSSHKPRSSNSKDEHHRHTSRREERQRERDAEKKKREAPPSGFKGMFKKLFT